MSNREVVIVSAVRTPMGRAHKGTLAYTRPDDLAALVLQEAVKRAGIEPSAVEDVVLGCAMPEAEQGLNVARQAVLLAGFPDTVPGATINRFCSSGLQAIATAAQSILAGSTECAIAGGVESMSMVPMTGHHFAANLRLLDSKPGAYLGMGQTAENVAERYHISRAIKTPSRCAATSAPPRLKTAVNSTTKSWRCLSGKTRATAPKSTAAPCPSRVTS
jgi:acetyl-CoA acyltransferase